MAPKRVPVTFTTYDDLTRQWAMQPYQPNGPDLGDLKKHPMLSSSLFQTVPFMIFAFDYRQQAMTYVSDNSYEVLGYWAATLMEGGMLFLYEQMPDDDRNRILTINNSWFVRFHELPFSLRNSTKFSAPFRFRHGKGETVWLLQQSVPMLIDGNGSILYSLNILTDITPFKQDNRVIGTLSFQSATGEYITERFHAEDSFKMDLTRREQEIIHMLIQGKSSKQIAEVLNISTFTVNNHRKRLLEKTGCKNSPELVRYALQRGYQ